MRDDFVRADERSRKRALILIIVSLLLAFLILYAVSVYFGEVRSLSQENPELALIKIKKFVRILLVANLLVTLVLGLYCMQIGLKSFRANRFPPDGVFIMKHARIHTGRKARIAAFLCLLVGLLLLSTNVIIWEYYKALDDFSNRMGFYYGQCCSSPGDARNCLVGEITDTV